MTNRLLPVLLLLVGASPARASEIPCSPVDNGFVQLDGLLIEWKEIQGVGADQASQLLRGRREWSGPDDLSFDLYCAHDDNSLYLGLDVHDDYFIRSPKARGDDHVVVLLGNRRLTVHPGDMRRIKGRLRWGARGRVKGIRMAEALQRHGYSLELRIPFKQMPGFRKGAPSYPGAVQVFDCDSKAKMQVQSVMGTAPSARRGRFAFAQARAELANFLRDRGFSPSQVRMRKNVNVVGGKQVEQVVLVGRTIGIIGDELPGGGYFYLDVPVSRPRDLYWLKLLDLNGDGKYELVARYVERAGNGRREMIVVYRFNDVGKFVQSFAHEILKGQGKKMITNRFSIKRRRRRGRKPGGVDLIFDKPRAIGFTKETFREAPCRACYSILLPWGEEKRRHFVFEGEQFFQR